MTAIRSFSTPRPSAPIRDLGARLSRRRRRSRPSARDLWREAFGTLTYCADAAPATDETIFDLASLTKVIATATQTMRAIDAGTLALDRASRQRLPAWRGADRAERRRSRDLLAHASGLTAYLPFFRDHHGRAEFERAHLHAAARYAPRTQSIYSDLGFILLGFILEDAGERTRSAMQFETALGRLASGREISVQSADGVAQRGPRRPSSISGAGDCSGRSAR